MRWQLTPVHQRMIKSCFFFFILYTYRFSCVTSHSFTVITSYEPLQNIQLSWRMRRVNRLDKKGYIQNIYIFVIVNGILNDFRSIVLVYYIFIRDICFLNLWWLINYIANIDYLFSKKRVLYLENIFSFSGFSSFSVYDLIVVFLCGSFNEPSLTLTLVYHHCWTFNTYYQVPFSLAHHLF